MTENKHAKKLQSTLKWLGWISGLIAKFLPASIRVWAIAFSTLAGGLVTLLDKCDHQPSPPAPAPLPTVTITPSPTPSPTPTPPPPPTLKAPRKVKVGELFIVQLCNVGNRYNVHLYVDQYRLGYMGFNTPCMQLSISLNTAGNRRLSAIDETGLRVELDVVVE